MFSRIECQEPCFRFMNLLIFLLSLLLHVCSPPVWSHQVRHFYWFVQKHTEASTLSADMRGSCKSLGAAGLNAISITAGDIIWVSFEVRWIPVKVRGCGDVWKYLHRLICCFISGCSSSCWCIKYVDALKLMRHFQRQKKGTKKEFVDSSG